MLQLKDVYFQLGSKQLLEKANLTIHQYEKVGIVGANGTGKSSLFKLLQGKLEYERGEVDLPKNLRIAEIYQEIPQGALSALDYAISGDKELLQVQQQLIVAEKAGDGLAIGELHARLAEIDGYTAESRAAKILIGLGFKQEEFAQSVDSFSGGWRVRLNLAQVLMTRCDLLLLDEPTNHLDIEAVFWLEHWLKDLKCTVLIISHDRDFLDRVVSRIAVIRDLKLHSYSGNYSSFETQYAEQLKVQQATFDKQQQRIAHLQSFVDRFRARASKAKQAQSRIKAIDKIEQVVAVHVQNPFSFEFKPAPKVGIPMLTLKDVSAGYDSKTVLSGVNFSIYPGDRIALLGVNGAGKSTLVKVIAGKLKAQGEIVNDSKLKVAYFAQHQLEHLQAMQSALWHLQQLDEKVEIKVARQFLGSFNFQGDRIFEEIEHFSGGEKARLALALLVWQQPNLLLMDEPSNHLDLEMREALVMALQEYDGALILIAHDRYLLKNLVDNFWLIDQGHVAPFDGDVDDYQAWFEQRTVEKPIKKLKKTKTEKPVDYEQQWIKLEAKIEKQQQALRQIEESLLEHALYQEANKGRLAELLSNKETLLAELKSLEQQLAQVLKHL